MNTIILCSAYAEMFEERTGIEINQVVILVVTVDGTVQEFRRDKKDYIIMLEDAVTEWSITNETPVMDNVDVSVNRL